MNLAVDIFVGVFILPMVCIFLFGLVCGSVGALFNAGTNRPKGLGQGVDPQTGLALDKNGLRNPCVPSHLTRTELQAIAPSVPLQRYRSPQPPRRGARPFGQSNRGAGAVRH